MYIIIQATNLNGLFIKLVNIVDKPKTLLLSTRINSGFASQYKTDKVSRLHV